MNSRKLSRYIPFAHSFLAPSFEVHRTSFVELIVVAFFALMPIWAGAFIAYAIDTNPDKNVAHILYKLLQTGEFYLYAAATLAPVLYTVFRNEEGKTLVDRMAMGVMSLLVYLACFIVFGMQRSPQELDALFIFKISCAVYIVSLFLFYTSILHRNLPSVDYGRRQRSEEETFTADLGKLRDKS